MLNVCKAVTRSPRQCDATPPDLTSRAHQDVEQFGERTHVAFGIDVVHDVVACPDEQSPACHWYYRKGHMAVIFPLQDNYQIAKNCRTSVEMAS